MKLGIDEHRFGRDSKTTRFATFFMSHSFNKRAFEIVEGRSKEELMALVGQSRSGCYVHCNDGYERAALKLHEGFFPNATTIIGDKFHVLRLLNPVINQARKEITGDRRTLKVRGLLLWNGPDLDFKILSELHKWLSKHSELRDIKEALHRLYRTHGYDKARNTFKKLLMS